MGTYVFDRIPVSCVVLLLMVALVTGCETGDSFSATSESRGGRGLAGGGSASGSVPHFSSIAAISFLSREEVEAAQEVRAQEINGQEGGGQLRQLVYVGTSDGRPLNYRAEELSGGLPVFYTPVANPGQSNLGPVWDRQGEVQLPAGPRGVEYTWTLPPDPSGKPILLFFNQRETASALGNLTALPDDYHVVEGNTVVLRLEPEEGGWRASINGEVLPESATSRISGYLGPPAFYSRRHGEHSVTTQALDPDDSFIPGGEGGVKTIRYFQKGLTLTEPLPEPNEENPREPMRIENTIAWSDDSALTDEEISWSAGASDKTYYGEGTDIAVVWDPLRQTFNEILNRAPTDEELEEIEVTKFEELDMSVTARTRVYEEKEASNLPSLEYVLRQNFGVLGAAELVIVGAKVLPEDEELFTEENPEAMLMADVVLVGPAPEDFKISWVVAIKTPDPEEEPIEIESGTGFHVDAVWDGTLNGSRVPNPLEHEFVITAKACPDDGVVAGRAIRGQETGDCDGGINVVGTVALSGLPPAKLEVYFEDSTQIDNRIALGFSPDFPNATALAKEQDELSRELYRLGTARVFLELRFSEEPPPDLKTVRVELSAPSSNIPIPKTLQQDESDKTLFKGDLVIPSGILQPQNGSGTRYNLGTLAFSEEDAKDWETHILPTFQQPHQRFGIYREVLFDPKEEPQAPDEVVSKPVHLAKLGFETISVSTRSPLQKLVATINVPNPDSADVVAWTFHGLPNGELFPSLDIGKMLGNETLKQSRLVPRLGILLQDSANLDTLFLSACSALHLQDYNQTGLHDSTASGAQEWHSVTGQGRALLLGYQYYAVRTNVLSVYEAYGSEYQRLTNVGDPRQRQILAWMSANLKVGKSGLGDSSELALGACAVDRDWYYYIPARYRVSVDPNRPYPDANTATGVYRIPRSRWSSAPSGSWRTSRDVLSEAVLIP